MTTSTWQALYDACTPEERQEIAVLMLAKIEARRREAVELFKREPRLLDTLPASTLREIASNEVEEAHQIILTAFPEVAGMLAALECLSDFSTSKVEPSLADILDVKASLEDVWKAARDMDSRMITTSKPCRKPAKSVYTETKGKPA